MHARSPAFTDVVAAVEQLYRAQPGPGRRPGRLQIGKIARVRAY